jgi:hypothetical protein
VYPYRFSSATQLTKAAFIITAAKPQQAPSKTEPAMKKMPGVDPCKPIKIDAPATANKTSAERPNVRTGFDGW